VKHSRANQAVHLLLDIGNSNTHVGLANSRHVIRHVNIPTLGWFDGSLMQRVAAFLGRHKPGGCCFCSVVPRATQRARKELRKMGVAEIIELSPATLKGLGIDYPRPDSIGTDRLANALAARHQYGSPVVVVDFGTAVTFDVVNGKGNYIGGIIAPGLSAMTDYLHEKTALLPRIKVREIHRVVGKSTEQAMLIGAVHGYRGLIRELLMELKTELGSRRLPVIATGGYARLMAARLPEIQRVDPLLTLEGLRLLNEAHLKAGS
jgi:type III pantothenate kinase